MSSLKSDPRARLTKRDLLAGGGLLAVVAGLTYYFNLRRRDVDLRFGEELDWLNEDVAADAIAAGSDLPPSAMLRILPVLEKAAL